MVQFALNPLTNRLDLVNEASGDVVGPGSSTTGDIAIFADTTGLVLADSGITTFTASLTTSDATPTQLFSLNLGATPAVYGFTFTVIAYNSTDLLGAIYFDTCGVRTNGAAAAGIPFFDTYEAEEGAMSAAVNSPGVTGNTFDIIVTGIAAKTIKWKVNGTYTLVS